MTDSRQLPDLADRFLPPAGWREDSFTGPNGYQLRWGCVMPEETHPRAFVVILPGLSDFAEKYFEVMRDMLARGLGVFIMDWQGQGKSARLLPNRQKRHARNFDEDLADFHAFMTDIISPQTGDTPLIMLAHSMGGHLGLRYLHDYPETAFTAAAFTAPMVGIQALRHFPLPAARSLSAFLNRHFGDHYVWGGHDWSALSPKNQKGHILLTSDPERGQLQTTWFAHDPDLQVGDVTFGWVHAAVWSCSRLQNPEYLSAIKVPCLLGLAGKELLVDNRQIRRAAQHIPKARLLELPDSLHEILMERDPIRNTFLAAFDDLLTAAAIG